MQWLILFLIGGAVVSLFATAGHILRPKGFAGTFQRRTFSDPGGALQSAKNRPPLNIHHGSSVTRHRIQGVYGFRCAHENAPREASTRWFSVSGSQQGLDRRQHIAFGPTNGFRIVRQPPPTVGGDTRWPRKIRVGETISRPAIAGSHTRWSNYGE